MSGFGYNVLGFGANAAGGGEDLPSDDEFNLVSFLSHFDGDNEGVNNVFIDGHDTSNPHTITKNGNVTQGSFGPFARPDGEWGVTFDGVDDSYLTTPNSSDFAFGTGDFTIEFWFNPNHTDTGYILDSRGTGVNGFYLRRTGSNGDLRFTTANGSSFTNHDIDANTVNSNWYHFCVTRASAVTKFFINGSQVGSDGNDTSNITSTDLNIGASYAENLAFTGIISNLRIIKGTAVNPTELPTSPATNVTNTVLLTCQSNRFVDNSSSGHTIEEYGGVAVTAFGPLLTRAVYDPAVNGASAYFSASGDYLSAANSSEFFMENDAYTIEFWNFGGPTNGTQYIFDNYKTGTSGGMTMYLTTAGKIHFRFSGNTGGYKDTVTSNGAFIVNQWSHIAVVRTYVSSNTTVVIYVNGVAKATETFNNITAQSNTSEALTIGFPGQYAYIGYVCDFRMVKGTAVYTGNFTPPTAPLTAVTNTKLLLNMSNGQAIDNSAQNNLTLYGTAKTSTAQYKFGTASLLLDGNSDYATFPENSGNDIDGGGNWTVEFFWRFVNKTSPSTQEIISKGVGLQIYTIDGSLGFALSVNNSGTYFINIRNGTTLDNDTWYHLALVKNGTSYKLYLNGTSDLSATSSSNIDTGGYPWFLGTISGAESTYASNGYMDEVRISKFARYTGNFTAPSEPFADKGQ